MKQLKQIGAALAMAVSALSSAHATTEVNIYGGPNPAYPTVAVYGTTYYQEGGAGASIALNSYTGVNFLLAGHNYNQPDFVRAVEYFANTDNAGSFAAYCIGITDSLQVNGSTYQLSDTQSDSLGRLFGFTGFNGANWSMDGVTAIESVALQVAIWEVMEDGLSSYDLSGGTLQFIDINPTVASLANQFLYGASNMAAGSYSTDVRVFTSLEATPSQPLVTTVPEPSTYAMLAACLGVIGLVARRKSA